MNFRPLPFVGLAFFLPLLLALSRDGHEAPPAPLDPERPLLSLVPDRALAVVDASGLVPLLEQGLDHPLARRLLAAPELVERFPDLEGVCRAGLAFADAYVGRPVLAEIAGLARRGAVLAVALNGGEPRALLLLRGADPGQVGSTLRLALELIGKRVGIGGLENRMDHVHGADVWRLGELSLAGRDDLVVASNDATLFQETLALAAEPATGAEPSLLARAALQSHLDARGANETLFAWTDLERLERAARAGLDGFRRRPESLFLLGPGLCSIASAKTVSASLVLDASRIVLDLHGRGVAGPEDDPTEVRPRPLRSAGQVVSAVVHRDLAGLFRERTALFPPEAQPGLAKGLSNLALFFGGKDLVTDVLPNLSPWIRLVARPVTFARGRQPGIPLPALAVVVRVRDATTVGGELVSAFQSVIGFMNVERAQQGRPGLQLHLAFEGGVELTSARFPEPAPEDGVDLRYNLEPACALVGSDFVLGTHVELVRELTQELRQSPAAPARGETAGEHLELAGPAIAACLTANREALAQKRSLEETLTLDQARRDVDAVSALLRALPAIVLDVDGSRTDSVDLRLAVEIAPAAARPTRSPKERP